VLRTRIAPDADATSTHSPPAQKLAFRQAAPRAGIASRANSFICALSLVCVASATSAGAR
jgi:hypothetical protein